MDSRDTVVCIVTSLRTGRSVVWIPAGTREFCSPNFQDLLCCPPSLLFHGYRR